MELNLQNNPTTVLINKKGKEDRKRDGREGRQKRKTMNKIEEKFELPEDEL